MEKSNDAPFGGIPWNLLVVIEEEQDTTIKHEGDNLHKELYISFAETFLGTSKEINTVGGKVKIKIDAGTQSGKFLISRKRFTKHRFLRKKAICLYM